MEPVVTSRTRTAVKPESARKEVCLASSTVCMVKRCERNVSTKLPAVACLKTSSDVRPRPAAATTSAKRWPVRVTEVVSRIDCMASAEEVCNANFSSFSRPNSPVWLLPVARTQNQQVCSLIFCCPTNVSTRFMCSTLAKRSSTADPNGAVSSRMARMSVMALLSTSRSCCSRATRWMPASTPKNKGSLGDPLSASSDIVSPWHSTSCRAMFKVSDRV
mmetsp:Transcript_66970/g.157900  ORF Transcript_66970/g.157900 Transcript_66970/m.157900 type:complete len:218 (-) Transcript_66970:568-1221(-)